MKSGEERRRHRRYSIPVLVEAPSLSEFPLVPEDVSAGGFQVIASAKPNQGSGVELTVQIYDKVFRRCRAQVVWVKELQTDPVTWAVGLSMEMRQERQKEFAQLLEKAFAEIGSAS